MYTFTALLLVITFSVVNFALGFALAAYLGHGPAWLAKYLPPSK
jgi:hypothetical protein